MQFPSTPFFSQRSLFFFKVWKTHNSTLRIKRKKILFGFFSLPPSPNAMNWSLSSLIFLLGILGAIATFVLFIIACVSNTPFNMVATKSEMTSSCHWPRVRIHCLADYRHVLARIFWERRDQKTKKTRSKLLWNTFLFVWKKKRILCGQLIKKNKRKKISFFFLSRGCERRLEEKRSLKVQTKKIFGEKKQRIHELACL